MSGFTSLIIFLACTAAIIPGTSELPLHIAQVEADYLKQSAAKAGTVVLPSGLQVGVVRVLSCFLLLLLLLSTPSPLLLLLSSPRSVME